MDELRLLASGSNPPDILPLAETWLDAKIKACEVKLPSYRLLRRDRDRHGSGVAVYVNESIPVRSFVCHPTCELLSVELETKSGVMLIGIIYRPRGHDTDLSLLESAIGLLYLAKYREVLVVGDFNVNLSAVQAAPAEELLALMSGLGYINL